MSLNTLAGLPVLLQRCKVLQASASQGFEGSLGPNGPLNTTPAFAAIALQPLVSAMCVRFTANTLVTARFVSDLLSSTLATALLVQPLDGAAEWCCRICQSLLAAVHSMF